MDEAHFRAEVELRAKWVLRGEPAPVDTASPRKGEKATYYSAVCLETGEVEAMPVLGNSNAATSVAFLKQLRARHAEPLIVIWDNGPAHRGPEIRHYLTTPDLKLRLVALPGYNPDFNPDEAIWDWIREDVTANTCFGVATKLREHLGAFFAGLAQRTDEVKQPASVLFPYEVCDNTARLYTSREMQRNLSLAWAYLLGSRKLLEGREKGMFLDSTWYRFGRTQNLGMWERSKLMLPYMITRLAVYPDRTDHYDFINVATGGYGLLPDETKVTFDYLSSILNSRLLDFYLKRISTTFHGGYFAANKQYIERLPIRTIDFTDPVDVARHDRMVALVTQMLDLHKRLAAEGVPQEKVALQRLKGNRPFDHQGRDSRTQHLTQQASPAFLGSLRSLDCTVDSTTATFPKSQNPGLFESRAPAGMGVGVVLSSRVVMESVQLRQSPLPAD